jgi:dTDP-4-amino-4,6-dideoxy-D-galactose acyltransferase
MEDFYLLDWDSRFFGYKIAAIKALNLELTRLNTIIAELRKNDFKLAYCFASPEDLISNDSFRKISVLLADEKITYSVIINKEEYFPSSGNITSYDLKFTSEKLKMLALQSGIYSRFKIDPDFHDNEYEKLYLAWIEKSVNKELSNEVLIYTEETEILGFITVAIKDKKGSIGLIAVDENQRGKAIGKKLINDALSYFKSQNVTTVEVVTQKANTIACKFYESLGFKIKSIVNIYHLWIR